MSPVERSQDALRPQAPRADELPKGCPGLAVIPNPGDFDARGKFAEGNTMASVGGKSKAGRTRLAARLTLGGIVSDPAFRPYLAAARGFRKAQCAAIALQVGGGVCGPAPSSIIASSALQLAASRYLFDLAGQGNPDLFAVASKLANDSRQNLLAAFELAAKEGRARVELEGDDLSRRRAEFQANLARMTAAASAATSTATTPPDQTGGAT